MHILDRKDEWLTEFREGWLRHYQQTGETDWKLYQRPHNRTSVSGPGIDLKSSRLLLISTAGGYVPGDQDPFDAENDLGDYSIRVIPTSTPVEEFAFAHDHYVHESILEDSQTLLPVGHLDDLVEEGEVGEVAPFFISIMGYQPDVSRVVDETIPEILEVARSGEVEAALLVPA
jgi:D-proline reductase (dithiol) PrdB